MAVDAVTRLAEVAIATMTQGEIGWRPELQRTLDCDISIAPMCESGDCFCHSWPTVGLIKNGRHEGAKSFKNAWGRVSLCGRRKLPSFSRSVWAGEESGLAE